MINQNTGFFQLKDNFKEHKDTASCPVFGSSTDVTPKITIAITTFKRPELLKICLDSAINQVGNLPYEVIVVDNDPVSGTETEKLLETYRHTGLTYYKNAENIGMFGNWNRCFELARGEYTTILNDDDWLDENYIRIVTDFIDAQTDTDLLLVKMQPVMDGQTPESDNPSLKYKTNNIFFIEFLFGNINPGSLGILFKTEIAKRVGGFDNSFYPTADMVFLINYLASVKKAYRISKLLAYYRVSVNESFKTSVQVGNIEQGRLLRTELIGKLPKLKFFIKLAIPVFDYYHFISVCNYSEEFKALYSSQLPGLKKKVKIPNRLSYLFLKAVRKVLLKKPIAIAS